MVRGRPKSETRREIISVSVNPEYAKLARAMRWSPSEIFMDGLKIRIDRAGQSGKPIRAIIEALLEENRRKKEEIEAAIQHCEEYLEQWPKPPKMVKAYNPEKERYEVISEDEVTEYHENITPIFKTEVNS